MGTRSLTHIHESDSKSKILTTIYRQFDGYPEGMGKDIFEAIGSRKLVNGYQDENTETNGMGCAAALLIANLKSDFKAGNTYIYSAGSKDVWEDYTYSLYSKDGAIHLTIKDGSETIFKDALAQFDMFELSIPE